MHKIPAYLPRTCAWRTVAQAAEYFGKSERTIRNWCHDGTFASMSGYCVVVDPKGCLIIGMPREDKVTSAETSEISA